MRATVEVGWRPGFKPFIALLKSWNGWKYQGQLSFLMGLSESGEGCRTRSGLRKGMEGESGMHVISESPTLSDAKFIYDKNEIWIVNIWIIGQHTVWIPRPQVCDIPVSRHQWSSRYGLPVDISCQFSTMPQVFTHQLLVVHRTQTIPKLLSRGTNARNISMVVRIPCRWLMDKFKPEPVQTGCLPTRMSRFRYLLAFGVLEVDNEAPSSRSHGHDELSKGSHRMDRRLQSMFTTKLLSLYSGSSNHTQPQRTSTLRHPRPGLR